MTSNSEVLEIRGDFFFTGNDGRTHRIGDLIGSFEGMSRLDEISLSPSEELFKDYTPSTNAGNLPEVTVIVSSRAVYAELKSYDSALGKVDALKSQAAPIYSLVVDPVATILAPVAGAYYKNLSTSSTRLLVMQI